MSLFDTRLEREFGSVYEKLVATKDTTDPRQRAAHLKIIIDQHLPGYAPRQRQPLNGLRHRDGNCHVRAMVGHVPADTAEQGSLLLRYVKEQRKERPANLTHSLDVVRGAREGVVLDHVRKNNNKECYGYEPVTEVSASDTDTIYLPFLEEPSEDAVFAAYEEGGEVDIIVVCLSGNIADTYIDSYIQEIPGARRAPLLWAAGSQIYGPEIDLKHF